MYDVIIIGKGPAGISAALYTTRAKLNTLVIGKGYSEVAKAEKIENYYGFPEPISGRELLDNGIKQATRLGAVIIEDEVISLGKNAHYKVSTSKESYEASAVLLATGQVWKKTRIENLSHFEGRGVAYCSTCDGFFYKDLAIGVLGNQDYAAHEASELENFSKNITLFTNGQEIGISGKYAKNLERYKINKKKIAKLEGGEFLEKIVFDDATEEKIDGLFVAFGSASSADFAKQLGVVTDGDTIVTDDKMMTNLEGLFAAGDCTGGLKQIAVAVGKGALAGKKIIDFLKNKKI